MRRNQLIAVSSHCSLMFVTLATWLRRCRKNAHVRKAFTGNPAVSIFSQEQDFGCSLIRRPRAYFDFIWSFWNQPGSCEQSQIFILAVLITSPLGWLSNPPVINGEQRPILEMKQVKGIYRFPKWWFLSILLGAYLQVMANWITLRTVVEDVSCIRKARHD